MLTYVFFSGQWWRFITPIFLHAGLIHLVFNLIFQIQQGKILLFHFLCFSSDFYLIGVPLEREFGSLRILPIYIVAGIYL